ncbi:hypothetical protein U9M48_017318 [Paspalum notatum var. saurae]|uniref:Uncharacterized protein n=1 Tax=Paspalum notatum var. saurae TaxID=547442 RepID=A0AAQ3T8L7_PASNO
MALRKGRYQGEQRALVCALCCNPAAGLPQSPSREDLISSAMAACCCSKKWECSSSCTSGPSAYLLPVSSGHGIMSWLIKTPITLQITKMVGDMEVESEK